MSVLVEAGGIRFDWGNVSKVILVIIFGNQCWKMQTDQATSVQQSNVIENVQKLFMKMDVGPEYSWYVDSLPICGLEISPAQTGNYKIIVDYGTR